MGGRRANRMQCGRGSNLEAKRVDKGLERQVVPSRTANFNVGSAMPPGPSHTLPSLGLERVEEGLERQVVRRTSTWSRGHRAKI